MTILQRPNVVFSKDNVPEAKAASGEIVVFKTQDCFAGEIKKESDLVRELNPDTANPSSGPLYVEGAQPGDVLKVDILDVQVADSGVACTFEGLGPLSDRAEIRTRVFPVRDGFTEYKGLRWPIDPMIGVIGTAPREGAINCEYAEDHGGNMDSRLIKKGSTVYLPVWVAGGLLQMGDIHATMGDGELCGTGIEIDGEITARVTLIKNFELNWPVTETPGWWFVNARGSSYEDSLNKCCDELARLMGPVYGWDLADIFIYLSVQGSVEINQATLPAPADMVNVRVGVPKLPDKALIK